MHWGHSNTDVQLASLENQCTLVSLKHQCTLASLLIRTPVYTGLVRTPFKMYLVQFLQTRSSAESWFLPVCQLSQIRANQNTQQKSMPVPLSCFLLVSGQIKLMLSTSLQAKQKLLWKHHLLPPPPPPHPHPHWR